MTVTPQTLSSQPYLIHQRTPSPSHQPVWDTVQLTHPPTNQPTNKPSNHATKLPMNQPSSQFTLRPLTNQPTNLSLQLTDQLSNHSTKLLCKPINQSTYQTANHPVLTNPLTIPTNRSTDLTCQPADLPTNPSVTTQPSNQPTYNHSSIQWPRTLSLES